MRFSPNSKFAGLVLAGLAFVLTVSAHAQNSVGAVNITLTTIDVPGYPITDINGINNAGEMVGDYQQSLEGASGGYSYSNGVFTYFDYPGQAVTFPGGINDSGLIVGSATQIPGVRSAVVGFLYDGTNYTTLRDGGREVTYGYGINNAGLVVGAVGGDLESWNGFEWKNGQYKPVLFPGNPIYGWAAGINNYGAIVGVDDEDIQPFAWYHSFIYQNGQFTNIDVPWANQTEVAGINDGGIAVGSYAVDSGCFCAFARRDGKIITFAYPGAKDTFALGINNSGQIVGSYTSDNIRIHGFVSSPLIDEDFNFAGCCRVAVVEGR